MFGEIKDIFFIDEIFVEFFHLNIGFLAHDEHGNTMVCFDVIEIWDERRNKLENKHYIISFVNIIFLVL